MNVLRPLTALVACAVALHGGRPAAQVTPTALVAGGDGQPLVVAHDHGVHIRAPDGAWGYSCSAVSAEDGRWRWTGGDRVLAAGADGAWITENAGCRWNRTTGPVSNRPVAGVYQSATGDAGIDLAYGSLAGGMGIGFSSDGGVTSASASGGHLVDVDPSGVVGEADERLAMGMAVDGRVHRLRSQDGGQTYGPLPAIDGAWGGSLSPIALVDGVALAWDGTEFYAGPAWGDRLEPTGQFARVNPEVALDGAGGVWLAAYEEGLWRWTAEEGWWAMSPEVTSAVASADGRLLRAGPITHVDDPWVWCSEDLGGTWEVCLRLDDPYAFPADCESTRAHSCGDAMVDLGRALGRIIASEDGPASAGVEEGCGGLFALDRFGCGALMAALAALWFARRRRPARR